MRVPIILLAAGLLLTGCITPSNEDVVTPAAEDDAGPDTEEGGTPAAPEPSAPAPVAEDTVTPVEEPFEYAGSTPAAVCAWALPAGSNCVAEGAENVFMTLAPAGVPREVRVELAWTAASPATESLSLRLLVQHEDGWWTLANGTTPVTGASPLVVEWDVTRLDGAPLALSVSAYRGAGHGVAGTLSVGGTASAPQDFTVTGTMVTVPADA